MPAHTTVATLQTRQPARAGESHGHSAVVIFQQLGSKCEIQLCFSGIARFSPIGSQLAGGWEPTLFAL